MLAAELLLAELAVPNNHRILQVAIFNAADGLPSTPQAKHKVKCRLLLDVVVRERAAILELLAGKDQALLVRRDPLLVLDLRLDVVDGVGALDLECNGLTSEGFDEDLHATPQAKHKVKSRLLLDVVVGERAAILELLAREDQPLLVRRDPLLVLDLRLDVVDGVGALDLECDGLTSKGFDEDLHATPQAKHKVKSRLLLDVV